MVIEALTSLDRCDSCGAQAYVQVLLNTGDLLFCNHHWLEYKPAITPIALEIEDQSHRLTPNRVVEEDVQ